MAIFNSYVSLPEGISCFLWTIFHGPYENSTWVLCHELINGRGPHLPTYRFAGSIEETCILDVSSILFGCISAPWLLISCFYLWDLISQLGISTVLWVEEPFSLICCSPPFFLVVGIGILILFMWLWLKIERTQRWIVTSQNHKNHLALWYQHLNRSLMVELPMSGPKIIRCKWCKCLLVQSHDSKTPMFDCETSTFAAYFHILRHHFGFADEPPELCTAPPLASPTRRKVSEKVVKPWDQNHDFPRPNGGNHLPSGELT